MDKVMVMNQETWEMMRDMLAHDAGYSSDPIAYIDRYRDIEIIIDNEVPFNHVEVYEKDMYEAVLKYGKRSDADARDVE